ncbi:hypothetical protein BDV12DRAFT_199758 [Aspergillus spectabilis]
MTDPLPLPASLSQVGIEINRFVCLARIDRESNPASYTRLFQILILLHIVQGGYGKHPFSASHSGWGDSTPQIPTIINNHEQSQNLTPQDLLAELFLQKADFRIVAMTRSGHALFPTLFNELWFVVDASSLETGLINVMDPHSNGEIKDSALRRPFNLTDMMVSYCGNGWPLEDLIEQNIRGPWFAWQDLQGAWRTQGSNWTGL